jgi:nitrogen regulatory protein PII
MSSAAGNNAESRSEARSTAKLPKVMLTIVVEESKLEPAIAAIQAGARTGQHGDGKIFVNSVDAVYTVRTGKKTED